MSKRDTYYMQDKATGNVIQTNNPQFWKEYEQLPRAKGAEIYRQQYLADLRKQLKPGDKVYSVVRSVSGSGMSRALDLYYIRDNQLRRITHAVAVVTGWPQNDHGELKVSGCGMDMCFHTVYTLSHYLFPDGFGIEGKDALGRVIRPSTKAKAAKAVAKGFVFRGRNGDSSGWDNDGGYALTSDTI